MLNLMIFYICFYFHLFISFNRLQRIKVSAGLEMATLRYNSTLPEHSWLRQIMDMFNVEVNALK